ncbi:coiled-coil domain-containing protein 40 isoform X1 [Mugil cephalus]|uniref:coiled-coil domain-containing protein 40 isoform X1 n=1 Tax=Mugil cephalus TaxID=48193 RepID=UPI001FB86031|nr:coiled-coil domain-containing protein 40 isoform X1 [Mugil cephalus]
MQSTGEDAEGSSSQREKHTNLQDGSDRAAEDSDATVLSAPQDQSSPQSDFPFLQPYSDLSIAYEHSPAAANSLEENISLILETPRLFNVSTSEEDQEQLPEDEDEEEEFIVLDPEHPLVRRQQAALSIQLSQQLERINLGLKEKMATEKADACHIQEAGIEMFRVQEQLARMQNRLEDRHKTKSQAEAKHRQAQDQLEATKSQYASITSQDRGLKAKVSQLQAELDNVMLHLIFAQGVSEDFHSKVKIMNNARCKVEAEKTQAEDQKLKQDLYVERLTNEMEQLTQQKALYETQASAQEGETQAAKEALSEAEMEIESLLMVRKQLLQQWNSSLMSMRRRDEDFSAMKKAMRAVVHQVALLDREIESYKKSTTAEQEQNESLTVQLNWSQIDGATSKKLISQKQVQQEALQAHYSTCLRTLCAIECTLSTHTKEASTHQAELKDQQRQVEKQSSLRLMLEDKIMTHINRKLNHSKAVKYSQRFTSKISSLKDEKICQLKQLENKIFAVRLESQQIDQHVDNLVHTQEALDEEIANCNKLLTDHQTKASSFIKLIYQKQTAIANCNTKISQILTSTGHEDLSPLQIKVEAIMAQIDELTADIKSDQQLWIRCQGTLVGLTREMEANGRELRKLQTEYTGMQQKKIRLESQFEEWHQEENQLEKNSKMLKRDLLKLNALLCKNRQLSHVLEQENAFMETDFLHRLKEAEQESVQIQMKHEKTREEKEWLLNSLLEAERQIMLWDKRTQIVKETCSAVDSEVGRGDIQVMKAEIHCMEACGVQDEIVLRAPHCQSLHFFSVCQLVPTCDEPYHDHGGVVSTHYNAAGVRLNQLMKKQERLLRESEATVARRETIVLHREAVVHNSQKQTTKGKLSHFIQGLQRKIQEKHKTVSESKQVIRELQKSQVSLSNRLVQQKQQVIELCGTSCILDSDFVSLKDTKDKNLAHLLTLQSRTKILQGVCEGSYQALSTSTSVGAALLSQMHRIHTTSTILHHMCEEFPQHQGALRRLALTLAAKSMSEGKIKQ